MNKTLIPAAVCGALLVSGACFAAKPRVVDFGHDIYVQRVSDDGKVVVGLSFVPEKEGVFRWTPATHGRTIGGLASGRPAVSADGSVIAGTMMTDRAEAALWTQGDGWKPMSSFELIPPLPGWETFVNALSANGERMAGGTVPPPVEYGHVRAFSWNPDTWVDRWADFGWIELPKARKGSVAEATAITNDGLVQAGISSDIGGIFRAVRWTDGVIEQLRNADGELLGGESVACNADCSVIVGGGGGSSAVRPVLAWRLEPDGDAPVCYLRKLEGPRLYALRYYAYDVSEDGGVIVGAYYYVQDDPLRSVTKGFVWIGDGEGGVMHDLQTLLSARGQPYFDNWLNVVPTGVSADGRYLVGWGDDALERPRSWRIDLGSGPSALSAGDKPPPSSSSTRCPAAESSAERSAARPGTAPVETLWPQPAGVFRSADGRGYIVQVRGATVYGGPGEDRLRALVPLGGDHFVDPADGVRRSFVRDAGGLVRGMQQRRNGAVSLWKRQND